MKRLGAAAFLEEVDPREDQEQLFQRLTQPIPLELGVYPVQGVELQGDRRKMLADTFGWSAVAASAIANRFASLEFEVYRDDRGEIEIIEEHPLVDLIKNPNPIIDMQTMMWMWGFQWSQVGETYTQIVDNALGVPMQLWPTPPDICVPLSHPTEIIAGYRVTSPAAGQVDLQVWEMVRIYRPHPLTMYTALGNLTMVQAFHDAERYRSEHIRSGFEHDATPRVAIVSDADGAFPGEDEKKQADAYWKQAYHRRMGQKRGLPVYLPPGMKPHEFGSSDVSSANVDIGEQDRRQILGAYGVPESVLGLAQDVSRNTAEANDFVFDSKTILPIAEFFSSGMTKQLAQRFDPRLKIRVRPFVTRDKEFELKQEQSDLDRAVVTINQVRADRDLGEDIEWGDYPKGSFNDQPYTGEVEESGDGFGSENPFDLGPLQNAKRVRHVRLDLEAKKRTSWKRTLQVERTYVPAFRRAQVRVFEAIARVVLARYRKIETPRARVSADDLFRPGEFIRLYNEVIAPLRLRIFREEGEFTYDDLRDRETETMAGNSSPATFTLSEEMRATLANMQRNYTLIDGETHRRIGRVLSEGASAGESPDQIAKRLSAVIVDRKRARTIARTEVGAASQEAQEASFKQSGVVAEKVWFTQLDGKVRDSHQIDGQRVPLDKPFLLESGQSAMTPRAHTLPPEDRVNCRCNMQAITISEAETES